MPEFFPIDQNSDEWMAVRSGIPTSSEFAKVIAKPGPRGGQPIGRTRLLYRLAGEIITGRPEETYSNAHMARGHQNEPTAREAYEFITGNTVDLIGFVRNGKAGASPDGLVGDAGLWECKDAIGSVQVERLIKQQVPPEHIPQLQGQLMVTERSWCDFMSHCLGLPPLIIRVHRDEKYIKALRKDIDQFCDELNALVEKIRAL